VQARVWGWANVAHQEFIDPLQNGYAKDDDGILKPHATDELPAPTAISERWFVTARESAQCKSVAADHTAWLALIMSVQQ